MNNISNFTPLIGAARFGNATQLAALLPMSDPKEHNSFALSTSAEYGHTDIVKLLIPVSTPKDRDSFALCGAALNGHNSCVDAPWDVSDTDTALAMLRQHYFGVKHRWLYMQHKCDALNQRQQLAKSVDRGACLMTAASTNIGVAQEKLCISTCMQCPKNYDC